MGQHTCPLFSVLMLTGLPIGVCTEHSAGKQLELKFAVEQDKESRDAERDKASHKKTQVRGYMYSGALRMIILC
jgi:hypothetical protein